MKTVSTSSSPKNHWTYAVVMLVVLLAPFLAVFGFGLSAYCCLVWLLFFFL